MPPIAPGPAADRRRWRRLPALAASLVLAIGLMGLSDVEAQEPVRPLPSFAELEAEGATIGEIHIVPQDIFDTSDPKEDYLLFRAANALHIKTRAGVIRRSLLFKSGDRVSVRLIEEAERVLRGARYLYDVQLRPVAYRDGVVDIEVATRDTWSLDLSASASRTGGANTSSINIAEYNLLGTATALSYDHSNTVDRSSNEFRISNDRTFDGWTLLSYSRARNSDGSREAAAIFRPFYALDARWSAGITASKDDRIDAVYNSGNVISEYRHRQDQAEVIGGWSKGRVGGWVHRYSIGVGFRDDAFALEPGRVAPEQLPSDERLVAPFFRFEVIEDRFERLENRNQIGRPEFFALGLASTLQLGWASTGFGSSKNAWLYSGTVSRGFEPAPEQTLIASAAISGQYTNGQVRRQKLGGAVQYYLPQSRRWLFYASGSGNTLRNPDVSDVLLLGGDNGLRGYPLRYQSGHHRALITVEERVSTDVYAFRLFRLGAAAYLDVGRAWGGSNVNTTNPGWLANVGLGLRIFNVRAAFSNVLHLDLAFPLVRNADVERVQFLVKTRASF
jgi:hypothetical protein